MSNKEALFSSDGLDLSLGGKVLFRDLVFSFSAATHHVIQGDSGGGKSTLLRLIAALRMPDRGRIFYRGEPVPGAVAHSYRRRVMYVSQEPLFPGESVHEGLNLPRRLAGEQARSREDLQELLRSLLLKPQLLDENPGGLSGGEKMRLSILRALLNKPEVLLLDEPDAGLDNAASEALVGLLLKPADGPRVISVSHSPRWCEQVETHWTLVDSVLQQEQGHV